MADTLKSITNRIHWSLLLKPLALIAAWYWLPFWVFCIVAFVLYFFPALPRSGTFPAFLITLVAADLLSLGWLHALWLYILFFLIVGIRELMFVDRRRAYQILTLCLVALGLFSYASMISARGMAFAPWELVFGALALYLLLQQSFGRMVSGFMTFLMFELVSVTSLLPFNVFYMTALTFMSAAFLMDFAERVRNNENNGGNERWNPTYVFIGFSIFFLFTVFILVSNPWKP